MRAVRYPSTHTAPALESTPATAGQTGASNSPSSSSDPAPEPGRHFRRSGIRSAQKTRPLLRVPPTRMHTADTSGADGQTLAAPFHSRQRTGYGSDRTSPAAQP